MFAIGLCIIFLKENCKLEMSIRVSSGLICGKDSNLKVIFPKLKYLDVSFSWLPKTEYHLM